MEVSCGQLETPVLFITFKRPDTTEKVFESIRQARPKRLYIAQNIPKGDDPTTLKKWNDVRTIVESVDWVCDVRRLYREQYLDARTSISTAINWFFEHEEEGIILEDDCLPHPTFFRFCEELLDKYRDDTRIAMISGNNFQFGRKRTEYSYYFSRYPHIWGWASWRRSWRNYDVDMKLWPEIRDGEWLKDILLDEKVARYWAKRIEQVYSGSIDTWDLQWMFYRWVNNELAVLPNVNLVSNIGFGHESTHTKHKSKLSEMEVSSISFPLSHPDFVIRDVVADSFTEYNIFSGRTIFHKAIDVLRTRYQ